MHIAIEDASGLWPPVTEGVRGATGGMWMHLHPSLVPRDHGDAIIRWVLWEARLTDALNVSIDPDGPLTRVLLGVRFQDLREWKE